MHNFLNHKTAVMKPTMSLMQQYLH